MRVTAKRVGIGLAVLLVVNIGLVFALKPGQQGQGQQGEPVALSQMLDAVKSGQVTAARLSTGGVVVVLRDGRELSSEFPYTYGDELVGLLDERGSVIYFEPPRSWGTWVVLVLPLVLFGLFWVWLARRLPRPVRRGDSAETGDDEA